jgi:hypothetical protein
MSSGNVLGSLAQIDSAFETLIEAAGVKSFEQKNSCIDWVKKESLFTV